MGELEYCKMRRARSMARIDSHRFALAVPARLKSATVCRALLILGLAAVAAPAVAQTWKVEKEEAVSLQYRDAKDEESLMEVHCTGSESQVIVPVAPGVTDRKPLRLEVTIDGAIEKLSLPASVCGRTDGACVDRPAGQVSVYLLRRSGRDLALRLARSSRVAASGAGVSIAADANPSAFQEFSALCQKQRRIPAG